jgi:exosortase/archaeosortase family protein
LAFGAGSIGGQALLANTFVQRTTVVPFSQWQGTLVERYLLDGPLTVSVDPSCSGLDVIALLVAATLAYPVAWRTRLTGATLGVLMLLALNALRIASLAGASHSTWFQTLHVNVWPAVLIAAAVGWVVFWIRSADRTAHDLTPTARRFVAWSAILLGAYVVAVPMLTGARVLDRAARSAAHVAAGTLNTFGADASVSQQLLQVGRAQYLVTPDCVTTPLVAFYFAALFAYPLGWRTRLAGALAGIPLFSALAVLRLLTVALPIAVSGTSLAVTHAFNQILAGVVVVVAASLWWRGTRSHTRAIAVALGVAAIAIVMSAATGPGLATAWSHLLQTFHLSVPPGLTPGADAGDGQGALLVLPIAQVALFAATWVIARPHTSRARWVVAAAVLMASQFVFLALQGWMDTEGIRPFSALAIRGWALAIPVVLILMASRQPEPVQ